MFSGTLSRFIYAAWVLGIYCRALPVILLIIIIARIFLGSERRIIGLKLEGGPWLFPVFLCSGESLFHSEDARQISNNLFVENY